MFNPIFAYGKLVTKEISTRAFNISEKIQQIQAQEKINHLESLREFHGVYQKIVFPYLHAYNNHGFFGVLKLFGPIPRTSDSKEELEIIRNFDPETARQIEELIRLKAQQAQALAKLDPTNNGAKYDEILASTPVVIDQPKVTRTLPGPALIAGKVAELTRQGFDVVNFGMGQNGFEVLQEARQAAAAEALRPNSEKYSDARGLPILLEQVRRYFKETQNLSYGEREVFVGPGGKTVLDNLFSGLLQANDDVLIAGPHWPYPPLADEAHARAVSILGEQKNGYKITADQLQNAIVQSRLQGHRPRLFVLTNPSNPSGAVYSVEELKDLAAVLVKNNILVISDEFYDGLVFNGAKTVSIATLPGMRERTIIVGGASKILSMAGWRVAWAAGPEHLITDPFLAHVNSNGNTSNLDQVPAYQALKIYLDTLERGEDPLSEQKKEFELRANLITDLLNNLDLKTSRPQGAFYVFSDVSKYYGYSYINKAGEKITIRDDVGFVDFILEQAQVAAIPGTYLGGPHGVRFSFGSTDVSRIREGLHRLEKALSKLSKPQKKSEVQCTEPSWIEEDEPQKEVAHG